MEKCVRSRPKPYHVPIPSNSQFVEDPLRRRISLGKAAEGREIVCAYEVPGGLVHRLDVEWLWVEQNRGGQERIRPATLEDRVEVRAGKSTESRVISLGLVEWVFIRLP